MKNKHDIRIDRTLLHPALDYKLGKLLASCSSKGIYLIITEGFRTVARQEELYAQGRTKPGKVVTNARGTSYSSQHMWGIAFDIAINDSSLLYNSKYIQKVADIAKSLGIGWGGDWKSFKDTPHFYLKRWGSTTAELKKLYGTPDNFRKTWTKKVSRDGGLPLWKDKRKKKKLLRIPNGKKVSVLSQKLWYVKVKYNGKVGFVNKKYLK